MKRLLAISISIAVALTLLHIAARGEDSKPKPPTTPPSTAPSTQPVAEAQPDGSWLLKAERARIHGYRLHLESKPLPTLVYWIDPIEYPEWPQAVKKGTYLVEVTYSAPARAGGEFLITAAAKQLTAKTEPTADWQTFTTITCGKLTVLNDETSIAVRFGPNLKRGATTTHALMNIRSIKLTPTTEDPVKVKKRR